MLFQRVITAVALLALLLPALFAATPLPFAVFALVAVSAAGWEWARLNGLDQPAPALASGTIVAALCGATLWAAPTVGQTGLLWSLSALAWTLAGALALYRGPASWPVLPQGLRWALGLALLWLAWAALSQARVVGINFLLSVLCIVWASDICAYFAGRRFGRRKLAPSISPGKSWEGVAGAVLGVGLLAAAWLSVEQMLPVESASIFRLVLQRYGAGGLLAALVWLTALGIVGDLFESLVKRAAGAKDSSRLLPGHGGVLDRVDALLPVLPAALALITY